MITPELISIATQERSCATRLQAETAEALAVYFEGESLERYVEQFPKEDPEKFAWRKKATLENTDNYAKEVVEQYVEGVFRTMYPERLTGDADTDEWIYEDYQKWFASKVAPFALLCPELYVRISLPKPTGKIISKADQKQFQGRPKLHVIYPQNIVNLSVDHTGDIEWIAIRKSETEVVIYDSEEYVCLEVRDDGKEGKAFKETERDTHGFNRVPVVRFMHRENTSVDAHPKMGHSFMYSVVKKTLGALSYVSMLIEAGHYHLFPKLIMSEDTFKNAQKSGIGAGQPIIEPTGPDGKADGGTRYLTMSDTEMATIERILYERIPKAVYRAARLRDRSTETTQSGFSKAFDMVPEVAVLTQIAEYLYDGDYKIVQLLAEAADKDPNAITVEYPTTFDTKSIAEIATETIAAIQALQAANIDIPQTAKRLLATNVVGQLLPDVSEDDWTAIEDEIEKMLGAPVETLEAEVETQTEETPVEAIV